MSARDDLTRATEDAREQVRDARSAVTSARQARAGGSARNARQAERQLHALRAAVADDVRSLRERATRSDADTRRRARTVGLAGAGALSALLGTGLAARGALSRRSRRRDVQRQAAALAAALADQAARALSAPDGRRSDPNARRGGRVGLITVLAIGAATGAAALVRQRQQAPIDAEDLWLPERSPGPA